MKPHICFFSFNAYPLLSNQNYAFVGGAELRQTIIAKELVKREYTVSFVVYDFGQPENEVIDGITVYKTIPPIYKLNSIHAYYNAFIKIWRTLKKVNADIYIQFSAGRDMGFTSLFCKIHRKKFIYGLVSDNDVDINEYKRMSLINKLLHKIGLTLADRITAQTEKQRTMLKKDFKKESVVIKNPHSAKVKQVVKVNPPIVIWVGTIKPEWKQPELFLKLTKKLPDIRFQIIGGPSTNVKFYDQISQNAKDIPNLEFIGFVQPQKVEEYFEKATILVNTSTVEGFPNTFLQAWANNTVIVSLNIDPDGVLTNNQIGIRSGSFEQMVKDVQLLLSNPKLLNKMNENARKYLEKEHNITNIIYRYEEIF